MIKRIFHGLLLAVLVSAFVGIGCVGNQARSTVLTPALQGVAPRVLADAAKAPVPEPEVVAAFQARVAAADWTAALILWPQVKADVLAGIDAEVASGALGPTVADSYKERVARFEADLKLAGGAK